MFYHTLNPALFHLGPFEVRYYGIVYLLGFLAAYYLLIQAAKKKWIHNFKDEAPDLLLTYLILGLILGARLGFFLFYQPSLLLKSPLELFMVWHGGMSFHGGLLGLMVGTVWFCRRHNVSFYELTDLLIFPACLALFLGRIANFINGELWGTLTNGSWCVDYSKNQHMAGLPEGCRHPSQLYESAKNLVIFGVLYTMKKRREWKKGVLFWSFVLLYGALRFFITFLREDPRYGGLSTGQWLNVGMVFVALFFLYRIKLGSKSLSISLSKK